MSLERQLIEEFGTATFSDKNPKFKSLGLHRVDDDRDWKLENRIGVVERVKGMQHYANPLQLNQGEEGACVGFGTTGVINAEPQVHSFLDDFAFNLYYEARRNDPWPGEDYDGTSVRAGAKVATMWGFFSGYAFTQDVELLARYLLNHGPVTIGVDWHRGMDRVDPEGYVYATGEVRGGHCVVIDGVVWNMKGEDNRFRFRNSWGPDWGLNGRGRIKAADLQFLFDNNGSACTPVEV